MPSGVATPVAFTDYEVWVEVEGLPWAFGLNDRAASWFAGRAVALRRLGVKGLFTGIPRGVTQEVRPLDGDGSIGSSSVEFLDDDSGPVLDLLANVEREDDLLTITADLPADGVLVAAVTVNETPDAGAYPTTGGIFYLGRETFSYESRTGSTFANVSRCWYEIAGRVSYAAHTAGDVVSPYPRFTKTRRAVVYVSETGLEADKELRWAGPVDGVQLVSGLGAVRLTVLSLEADLKRQAFAGLRRGKLLKPTADVNGVYAGDAPADDVRTVDLAVDPDSLTAGQPWKSGQRILVRVRDEYFCGTMQDGHLISFNGADEGRAAFNSVAASHDAGEEFIECAYTGAYGAGSPEAACSFFTQGDHPFDVLVAILTSRAGDATNGAHDTLPAGWGLGIDVTSIATTNIADLRDRWLPSAAHREVIEDAVTFKEWAAQVLRVHGCYLIQRWATGALDIRRMNSPVPGDSQRTVDATTVVDLPSWDANVESIIGRIVLRCDYDPSSASDQEFRQKYTYEIQGPRIETQEHYAGAFKTHEIESKGQWSGLDSPGSIFGAALYTDADNVAARLFDVLSARFAKGFPTVVVETDWDARVHDVGDVVKLTLDHLPDITRGARGLSGALCEVRHKDADEDRRVVTLTLQIFAPTFQSRRLAPSAIVSGVAGAVLTVQAHAFSSASSAVDASHFPVNAVVRVYSPDLKTLRGSATVSGVSSSNITLGASVAGVVAGDVVVLAPYDSQPAAVMDTFAFLGDAAWKLGAADAAGHRYAA
jgi:hypothetical protein